MGEDPDFEHFGRKEISVLEPHTTLRNGVEFLNASNEARDYSKRSSFTFVCEDAPDQEVKRFFWLRSSRPGVIRKVLGIVTERDFIRCPDLLFDTPESTTISQIMTPVERMRFASCDQEIWEALQNMTSGRFRHLPVYDVTLEVTGCVNLQQLVSKFQKMTVSEIRALSDSVE